MVKSALATGRYVGGWPKIGIRPAIDGRRNGVRESLEGQTMGLARAAAEFLSANLRYADGQPVQCVVPDDCIGGVVEAGRAAERAGRAWGSADTRIMAFGAAESCDWGVELARVELSTG